MYGYSPEYGVRMFELNNREPNIYKIIIVLAIITLIIVVSIRYQYVTNKKVLKKKLKLIAIYIPFTYIVYKLIGPNFRFITFIPAITFLPFVFYAYRHKE